MHMLSTLCIIMRMARVPGQQSAVWSTSKVCLSVYLTIRLSVCVPAALKYSVVVRPDDTILQIFDLSLEDMGEYRVVATSPDGNATDSLTFDLTVQGQ